MNWQAWASDKNATLRAEDRWRECRKFDTRGLTGVIDGKTIISFASNDYLGLSNHPTVLAAAHAAIDRWGTGAGASRLVTGSRPIHHELEETLALVHDTESAVVFPTGYAANLGVLTTFGTDDVTIFSDQLNHASIIDGCRLARAKTVIYRHGDIEQLQSQLAACSTRKLVVTESVFSMDGDCAPLQQIVELAARYSALLVVDEAHNVFPEYSVPTVDGLELLRVGTLSKTLGAMGGWVGGSQSLVDCIVNSARSFIFTTALAPADAAAALAALKISHSHEGQQLRLRLRKSIDAVRRGHCSAIVPIIVGSNEAALRTAEMLLQQDIYVPAIRPPTVAVGTARLRITLSAAHDDAMVAKLLDALRVTGIEPCGVEPCGSAP